METRASKSRQAHGESTGRSMDEHDDGALDVATCSGAVEATRISTLEQERAELADGFASRAGVGKLALVLARLAALWSTQSGKRRVSKLDGEAFFSETEWSALGDSALFAKLRRARDDEGGGGAPAQADVAGALPPRSVSDLEADVGSRERP